VTVGGLIEPFAFGSSVSPSSTLPKGEESGVLEVEEAKAMFSMQDAAGTGSYAPGGFFASSSIFKLLGKEIGIDYTYFPPASETAANVRMACADGGDMTSPHLIGLLLRGMTSVVFFGNFDTPLQPKEKWDAETRAPTAADIDDDLPPFFGIVLQDLGEKTSYDFSRNQVFAAADFPRVVAAMQGAQATGKGIVVTTELETIENKWWGLQKGHRVNVTWVYLSRAPDWEARLPLDLRRLVVPEQGGSDPTVARKGGPFDTFPYYGTGKLYYDARNTNLLADLCGWVLRANAPVLQAALA